MKQFLIASSQEDAEMAMLESCLEEIGPIPDRCNLGFLYASDHLVNRLQPMLDQLAEKAPEVHWVGTVGMAICTSGREIYDRPKNRFVAIALLR